MRIMAAFGRRHFEKTPYIYYIQLDSDIFSMFLNMYFLLCNSMIESVATIEVHSSMQFAEVVLCT